MFLMLHNLNGEPSLYNLALVRYMSAAMGAPGTILAYDALQDYAHVRESLAYIASELTMARELPLPPGVPVVPKAPSRTEAPDGHQ